MKNDNFSPKFEDQIIFITGGTSGIGLATAVQFVEQGAKRVIVCGRTAAKWEKAQTYLKKYLSDTQIKNMAYVSCDVRVEEQIKNVIKEIYQKYGRLDVAFNNAGVSPGIQPGGTELENMHFESALGNDGSIMFVMKTPQPGSQDANDRDWQSTDPTQASANSLYRENPMATSIFGVFYSMKWELIYAFKNQPKDLPFAIINTASRNGIIPDPTRPLYAASKAFIIALTKSLSNAMAQRCVKENRAMVRVNAIAPGPVDTPLERSMFPGSNFDALAGAGVPMQRVADPEEIAPAVLFLADSKQSAYITGAILPVDGGDVASPYIPPIKT